MTDLVLDTFPDTTQAHERVTRPFPVTPIGAALSALVRRRAALSVRTPRELFVPLLTPVLFALVIAPALDSIGPKIPGLDYMSFAAIGTAVLLIPLPRGLAAFARVLPATHALALMRYGLLGGNSSGLHNIWGMDNATVMAALSLGVVALFAAGLTFAALRTFRRTAVS
jgi:hypothetical protein